MNLLVARKAGQDGMLDTAQAAVAMRYVRFRELVMPEGGSFKGTGDAHELCLVVLAGIVTVSAGGQTYTAIGARRDVFERVPPFAVYLPCGMDYAVAALSNAEIGICGAPGRGRGEPRLIRPEQVRQSVRGEGSNQRYIHDILPETEPADSLLVVEVYTPPGNWSSYPPHKHDRDDLPREAFLEEIYYHRVNPPQGFGFQRVYTDDRTLDESIAFPDHSCVMVPRGYHPVGAPHGCEVYYLNVMAGPKREWKFTTDPDFAWLLGQSR